MWKPRTAGMMERVSSASGRRIRRDGEGGKGGWRMVLGSATVRSGLGMGGL